MKASSSLIAASALFSVLGASAAQAEEIALSFELPESDQPEIEAESAPQPQNVALVPSGGPKPLPIPQGAGNPPMRSHSPNQLPGGVYRRAVAVSLASTPPAALLPPAPPLYTAPPVVVAQAPKEQSPTQQPDPEPAESESEDVALSFAIAVPPSVQVAQSSPTLRPASISNPLASLFEGDSDSLVARAVGSAEGTRTPTGAITQAYYGHSDPGNGVWNMGTFSYQHGASSAAEADRKQLQRLQSQSQVLKRRAANQGLNLNLEQALNGIDLANQSPLASIGRVGYIERLVEAQNMGYEGFEAIVVARTRSYINPDTQRWNAPGLGNTLASITRDQQRRATAVAQAIDAYKQEKPHLNWDHWALMPASDSTLAHQPQTKPDPQPRELENVAIAFWTDGTEDKTDDTNITSTGQAEPSTQDEPARTADAASLSLEKPAAGRVNRALARLFSGRNPVDSSPDRGSVDPTASTLIGTAQPLKAALRPTQPTADVDQTSTQPEPVTREPEALPQGQGSSSGPEASVAVRGQESVKTTTPPEETETETEIPETTDPPSWLATREKHQTSAQAEAAKPLEVHPAIAATDTRSPSSPSPKSSSEESSPMTTPTIPGAMPETTVIPALREDLEPVAFPGLEQDNPDSEAMGTVLRGHSTPLPSGVVRQLKNQEEPDREDPASGSHVLKDHLAEKIFDIDLDPTPSLKPGLK